MCSSVLHATDKRKPHACESDCEIDIFARMNTPNHLRRFGPWHQERDPHTTHRPQLRTTARGQTAQDQPSTSPGPLLRTLRVTQTAELGARRTPVAGWGCLAGSAEATPRRHCEATPSLAVTAALGRRYGKRARRCRHQGSRELCRPPDVEVVRIRPPAPQLSLCRPRSDRKPRTQRSPGAGASERVLDQHEPRGREAEVPAPPLRRGPQPQQWRPVQGVTDMVRSSRISAATCRRGKPGPTMSHLTPTVRSPGHQHLTAVKPGQAIRPAAGGHRPALCRISVRDLRGL